MVTAVTVMTDAEWNSWFYWLCQEGDVLPSICLCFLFVSNSV